jgi:predicted methyltransferase
VFDCYVMPAHDAFAESCNNVAVHRVYRPADDDTKFRALEIFGDNRGKRESQHIIYRRSTLMKASPCTVQKFPLRFASVATFTAVLVLAGCAAQTPAPVTSQAPPASSSSNNATYQSIASNPMRTDADRAADARRKPAEFLSFVQPGPGMNAMDVDAGGGYTTQLLALAIGPSGKVYAQVDNPRPNLEKRLADHPQPNIIPTVRPFQNPVPAGAPPLDLVTLILNYHDIVNLPVDRLQMNRRLFDALKRGGHLVIVDHSARPGSGTADTSTLHRIEEATVISEVQQAGFRLEQRGDLYRNPSDRRDRPSSDREQQSDKFALKFVKP